MILCTNRGCELSVTVHITDHDKLIGIEFVFLHQLDPHSREWLAFVMLLLPRPIPAAGSLTGHMT